MEIGIVGNQTILVTEELTAKHLGSGELAVYATPCMIALMENASANSLLPYLAGDEGSVGTHLNVAHSAATPIGMKVWAESTVTAVEGKKITFDVVAYDEAGEIGRGTHERFIIKPEKFLAKCQAKLSR